MSQEFEGSSSNARTGFERYSFLNPPTATTAIGFGSGVFGFQTT